QSGGADTGEVYRLPSVADRRGVEVAIGSGAGDARIAIRAGQPLGFREFGAGAFQLAFEAIRGGKKPMRRRGSRLRASPLFEPNDRLVDARFPTTTCSGRGG